MKLRILASLLLIPITFTAVTSYAKDGSFIKHSIERLDASEPATYDLGSKLAVVFYYTDAEGDRLLVTAIGPKDPDSGMTSTQQIIKMDPAGEYEINIDSDKNDFVPMKLSARFEGDDLVVALDQV